MSKQRRSKSTRLLLADRSLSDLIGVEQYSIEQRGKKTAAKYLAQIEDALSLIQINPGLLRQEEGFPTGLRFYQAGKHVLVFDVAPKNLILLTVLHESMDIPARLAELEPTLATEVELLRKRLPRK